MKKIIVELDEDVASAALDALVHSPENTNRTMRGWRLHLAAEALSRALDGEPLDPQRRVGIRQRSVCDCGGEV